MTCCLSGPTREIGGYNSDEEDKRVDPRKEDCQVAEIDGPPVGVGPRRSSLNLSEESSAGIFICPVATVVSAAGDST